MNDGGPAKSNLRWRIKQNEVKLAQATARASLLKNKILRIEQLRQSIVDEIIADQEALDEKEEQ